MPEFIPSKGQKMIMPRVDSNQESVVGFPRDVPPVIPASLVSLGVDATSHNLGWVGLQAVRYRNLATNEIHIPALAEHLLVLHTKPPAEENCKFEGVKRQV